MTPAFAFRETSPAALAISLGGAMLAFRAFQRLATGMTHLAGAFVAWKQIASLFQAASRPSNDPVVPPAITPAAGAGQPAKPEGTLLEALDLVYVYGARKEPILQGCTLRIAWGDRILLEGPSGGGKSTLAALLAGLRASDSGLLLLGGLDRATLGPGGWRRRVAVAPQFHENHVLTSTFLFNLLMGGTLLEPGQHL